jgi:hypothetical protein
MTDINTIADLKQDSRNARKHTPRNVGMIEKSLGEVGAARSIVIDELGNILAGNATVEAAANAGMERVQVVDADGETIIAVRRTGLTPEQKVKLALYDNRTAELAEWDSEVLAGLVEEGVDLSTFWSPYELGKLGQEVNAEPVDFAAEWKGMPEFEQNDLLGAAVMIKVRFKTMEDMQDFALLIGQTVTENTKSIWHPQYDADQNNRDRRIIVEP